MQKNKETWPRNKSSACQRKVCAIGEAKRNALRRAAIERKHHSNFSALPLPYLFNKRFLSLSFLWVQCGTSQTWVQGCRVRLGAARQLATSDIEVYLGQSR